MKLMVFSDSHGQSAGMLRVIGETTPDLIIHLGDGETDIVKIKKQFPQIPLKAVRGNCDWYSDLPKTELFSVGNVKIFITHGHIFGVKRSLSVLIDEARTAGADIVMFGHTHVPYYSLDGAMHVLNPGSCGHSPSPSGAEIIISDNGDIFCRIFNI